MSDPLSSFRIVNRTDRLYAIVETLRAVSPRRRSARDLATRYEVSVRTIERDINALQQAGVPIYADAGRTGGYALDRSATLPPLNFTPAEAVAVAVALRGAEHTPFGRATRSALHKITAAMSPRDAGTLRELADRIRFFGPAPVAPAPPPLLSEALVHRQVLRIVYRDKQDVRTERDVEPEALLAGERGWYLVAHCRLRDGVRAFRSDRILSARSLGQPAPERTVPLSADVPESVALSATFD